jgi:hypothetical protein
MESPLNRGSVLKQLNAYEHERSEPGIVVRAF